MGITRAQKIQKECLPSLLLDISLQIWSDGGLCQLHIFLQMNYALIL